MGGGMLQEATGEMCELQVDLTENWGTRGK